MANKTIKDEAIAYQPTKITKNISELPIVSVDVFMEEETFKGTDGEPVTIKVVEVNGERYRVPASVLKDLKVVLEDNPQLKSFKVKRAGEGMNTRYTLIPMN